MGCECSVVSTHASLDITQCVLRCTDVCEKRLTLRPKYGCVATVIARAARGGGVCAVGRQISDIVYTGDPTMYSFPL